MAEPKTDPSIADNLSRALVILRDLAAWDDSIPEQVPAEISYCIDAARVFLAPPPKPAADVVLAWNGIPLSNGIAEGTFTQMKAGETLRIAEADHPGPVLVHHKELITALAMLVFQWECEVSIRLAPELVNALEALRAAGKPYAKIERATQEPRP